MSDHLREDMIVTVTIATENGSRSYTGHIVCRGPATMDMLLTEPFGMAGRSVQFPLADVISEETRPSSNGARPQRADRR